MAEIQQVLPEWTKPTQNITDHHYCYHCSWDISWWLLLVIQTQGEKHLTTPEKQGSPLYIYIFPLEPAPRGSRLSLLCHVLQRSNLIQIIRYIVSWLPKIQTATWRSKAGWWSYPLIDTANQSRVCIPIYQALEWTSSVCVWGLRWSHRHGVVPGQGL